MINREIFYSHIRESEFRGHLAPTQIEGIDAILNCWEKIKVSEDLRFLAYILATTGWETAHTMQPIEEIGHGRGHAYGVPTGPWHQVYDGRGDCQLTWLANYQKADTHLHAMGILKPAESMVKTSTLALRPDVAAAVLMYGMTLGWFTGKKLGDYFTPTRSNPLDARRIINGTDRAAAVAQIYQNFRVALTAPTRLVA